MTGESAEKTEPWVEEHGMQYAFGYMQKGALTGFMKSLGMTGYPSAALVNPKGTIVWKGHPSSISGGLIKKHLKGASKTPVDIGAVVRDWPKEAKHARTAFEAGKLAKALAEAEKLPEEWGVAEGIGRVIDKRVAKLQKLVDSGDYLGFTTAMKQATKSMAGLEKFEPMAERLATVQKDSDAKAVISGQKKLAKLAEDVPELRKHKDAAKLVGKIEKLSEKHSGTIVEASANKLLESIQKRRKRMR